MFSRTTECLWRAPELLRRDLSQSFWSSASFSSSRERVRFLQRADIYSLGIVLHEIFWRAGAWGHLRESHFAVGAHFRYLTLIMITGASPLVI